MLKTIESLTETDFRSSVFVLIDQKTGEERQVTLEDHHADIERYALGEHVPEKVVNQYEVARNLYLYAWYEYTFFNVAEAKVLTVLEFAIKERVTEGEIKQYCKERMQALRAEGKRGRVSPGLKTYIEYCRDNGLIKNEGFRAWQRYTKMQAYYQAEHKQMKWEQAEMARSGATEIELPDIQIEDLPPDPNYDHVQQLVNTVNRIRNDYAHGSSSQYNEAWRSFEMVSEFIDQIYQR